MSSISEADSREITIEMVSQFYGFSVQISFFSGILTGFLLLLAVRATIEYFWACK